MKCDKVDFNKKEDYSILNVKDKKQYELKKVLLKQHLEGKLDYICTNN